MALSPQEELKIREELETNPAPQRELALRERLESAGRPASGVQNKKQALSDTIIDQVRQRLPLPENLGILAERAKGLGRFFTGIPQGLQEGGVGLLQTAADVSPNIPGSARVLAGGAGLANQEDIQRGRDIITKFQDDSNRRFESSPQSLSLPGVGIPLPVGSGGSAETSVGRMVGRALPVVLGTKGLGGVRALSAPGVAGLAARAGTGAGVGFTAGGTEFIGGEDPNQDRLGRAQTGAVFGGAIPVGISAAQGTARFLKAPRQFILNRTLGRSARRGAESAAGKHGETVNKALAKASRGDKVVKEASKQSGLEKSGGLTLGARSRNPTLVTFEREILGSPRQLEKVTPTLNKIDKNIVRAIFGDFKKLRAGPARSAALQRKAGRSLRVNFRRTIDIFKRKRAVQAKKDFGEVNRLSNNQRIQIPTNNTSSALTKVTREVDDTGQITWARTLGNNMKKNKDFNLESLLNMRSRFSSASKGGRSLWKEFADSDTKRIAAKVLKAIDTDIDALVKSHRGPLQKSIRASINNYRVNSKPLNDIESTEFGQIMGKFLDKGKNVPDEVIAEKVLSMKPGNIRVAMPTIESRGGKTADTVRFLYLKNMVRKNWGAEKPSGSLFRLDARGLSNSFQKDRDKFEALFSRAADRKRVRVGFEAARLLGNPTQNAGGGINPRSAGQDVAGVAASRNITFLVRYMAKYLPSGIYRSALYTEAGQKAMITLAKPLKGQMVPLPALIKAGQELDREIKKNRENKK